MTARLDLRIRPGARHTGFVGWYGDVAKLAVSAPPVDGAANEAVVVALAKMLGLRRRHVRVIAGTTSRSKRLEIDGFTDAELRVRLTELNPRLR